MRIFNKAIYLEQISYKDNKKDYDENSLLIFITVTGRFLAMNKQTFWIYMKMFLQKKQ